jgi:hypothetical protein
MRAEFFHADAPDHVVAAASWDGRAAVGDAAGDADAERLIARIFRPAPVVVDDPSLRSAGTSGPVALEPGDLRWFMAAARTRGAAEGLSVRFVSDEWGRMGWDPAGAYRPFRAAVAPAAPAASSGVD